MSVSILLVPDGAATQPLRALVEEWVRSGLIEPMIWWPLSDADSSIVVAMGPDGSHETRLAEALQGARDIGHPMVLCPDIDGVDEEVLIKHADDRLRLLQIGLDGRGARPAVVVAPSQPGVPIGFPAAQHFAEQRQCAVVVIEPHDAAEVDAFNALSGSGDTYWAHVAANLATVGEWWVAVPYSQPRMLRALSDECQHSAAPIVRRVRSASRVIEGGYLLDHVAARASQSASELPSPIGAEPAQSSIDPELRRALVTAYFVQHRALFDPEPPQRPEKIKVGFVAAIKLFLRGVLWLLTVGVILALQTLASRIHDRFARWADKRLLIGPLDGNKRVIRFWERFFPTPEPPEPSTEPPVTHTTVSPVQEAWSELTQILVSVCDNGDLPPWASSSTGRSWNEGTIRDALRVPPAGSVPNPAEFAMYASPGATLRFVDRVGLASIAATLEKSESVATAEVTSPPAEGDGAVAPASDEEAADVVVDPEEAAERDAALQEISRLSAGWGDSLAWEFAGQFGERMASLEERVASIGADIATVDDLIGDGDGTTSSEFMERATEKSKNLRRVAKVAVLAALVAAVYQTWSGPWSWLKGALFFVGGVVLVTVWLLIAIARRIRRMLQTEKEAAEEREFLTKEQVHFRLQHDRLHMRYEEFLDWVEIVGRLLHPAYERTPMSEPGPVATVDPTLLPNSVQVAELVIERADLESWAMRTRRSLPGGWLWGRLRYVAEHARSRSSDMIGDPRAAVNPWGDTSRTDSSARLEMLRLVRSGYANRAIRDHVAEQAREALLGEVEQRIPDLTVRPLHSGEHSDALPPLGAWRAEPTSLPDLAASVRPWVVRVMRADGGGSGVVAGAGFIATNAHVVGSATTVEVLLHDGRTVPGKVAQRSNVTDLALVSVDVDLPDPPQLADWVDIRQGIQVFTLGYPHLLAGEPTLSWGLLSAVQRIINTDSYDRLQVFQHDAYIAGGSSGSPVFDLAGRLVGLNVAGDSEANYICFGIPGSALLEFSGDKTNIVLPVARDSAPAGEVVKLTAFVPLLKELDSGPQDLSTGVAVSVTPVDWSYRFGQPLRWQQCTLVVKESSLEDLVP